MPEPLIIWTYDWVPGGEGSPRGHVRDIRLRWACEEAGLEYVVRSVPFHQRGPAHLACQPFGQVPFLDDGGVVIFESGAALLHLSNKSEILMPRDRRGSAETLQWIIAALNSLEMVGSSGCRGTGIIHSKAGLPRGSNISKRCLRRASGWLSIALPPQIS